MYQNKWRSWLSRDDVFVLVSCWKSSVEHSQFLWKFDLIKYLKMVINFAAGPAKLPDEVKFIGLSYTLTITFKFLKVLAEVQKELLDFNGTEMSVMEMSHRGSTYLKIHEDALKSCRELL